MMKTRGRVARGLQLVSALGCVLAATVCAQQPVRVGSEFRVNGYTTGSQFLPSVSSDEGGRFVVVWNSPTADGTGFGIYGQRFQSNGVRLGGEFPVHSAAGGDPGATVVSADADGDFVVVWENGFSLSARRFSSDGQPEDSQFDVNVPGKDPPRAPSLTSAPGGEFVVVWTVGFAPSIQLLGQRYASDGQAIGSELTVPSYTTQQSDPSVSADANGDFVVVWRGPTQGGDTADVAGRRFRSNGQALGGEFRVNTYTTGAQSYISVSPRTVAREADGDFVVVWEGPAAGDDFDVFGRYFLSNGQALGSEFRVNTTTTDRQVRPSVASDAIGNFVAVWTSQNQDGDRDGVFGQLFRADGRRLGAEFRVNTFTGGYQSVSAVSSDADGEFVVVWASDGQDGNGQGVFGQRFAPPSVDLQLTLSDAPDPVIAGTLLTYTVQVRNLGPQVATGIIMRIELDPALDFVSGSTSGGAQCAAVGGTVDCTRESLAVSAVATFTVVVRPDLTAPPLIQSTAEAAPAEGFRVLEPSDDSGTLITTVLPPTMSLSFGWLGFFSVAGLGLLRMRRRRAGRVSLWGRAQWDPARASTPTVVLRGNPWRHRSSLPHE